MRVISGRDLSESDVSIWAEIQRGNPALDSPFFRPEFTQKVAAVRDDVEVAILQNDGRPIGYFPFQQVGKRVMRAVSGRLSDLHGVIVAEGTPWSPEKLVRACGLRAWYFDHLIQSQSVLQQYHWTQAESPYLDLRNGFAGYCEDLRSRKSRQLSQLMRKARKLEREVGRPRFELHTDDALAFESLRKWKSEQYERTNKLDIFQYDWVINLLEHIRSTHSDGFQGQLSVLYAGDHIAALHLGMRSDRVVHWWFPTYNEELAQYSPGLILLLELAKASESLGIDRIDLGKGDERYKSSLMNGAITLAEGAVDLRPVARRLRRRWHLAKRRIRGSKDNSALEIPLRLSRRFREWLTFR